MKIYIDKTLFRVKKTKTLFYNCNQHSNLWVLDAFFASCYGIKFKKLNGKIVDYLIKQIALIRISFKIKIVWMAKFLNGFFKVNLNMVCV